MKKENTLPELADLHHDVAIAFKNDQLNLLLNQEPVKSWLKEHPTAKAKDDNNNSVPAKYLPIDKVEFLLTKIFQKWRVEIINCGQLFNSVYCHVRLHYVNPISGEWSFHDGVGAVGAQTDKGESAANLNAIKYDAIAKGLPAAKSYAIKDAADHLGSLFGRDLNRKNIVSFTGSYNSATEDQWQELSDLYDLKSEMLTPDEQIAAERIIKNKEIKSFKKLHNQLLNK